MDRKPIALLFDLDGTLVDTIELIMQCMEFAFAEFDGRRPTRAEWLIALGIPLATQLAAHARSESEHAHLIARYRLYQGEHQDRMTVAYSGVHSVLSELHAAGHPMAIVTSKFHAGGVRSIGHVGLSRYFDAVVGGDSIENPKPHPEPVLFALAQLSVSPDRALMVGDSPHDIAAANAAGVASAAAQWGPFSRAQLTAAGPTYWLNAITDLPALVRSL